ncbi:capsule biosynthesis GfcC family protein [Photobacterium japonica]|uniref:capsule biosynthesis GfcC family protein n=1 Tax=Photobacterium japonica TaxID=2910235 RepID=UPI003D0C1898
MTPTLSTLALASLAIMGTWFSPLLHAQPQSQAQAQAQTQTEVSQAGVKTHITVNATYSLNQGDAAQTTTPQALTLSYPAPVRLEQVLADTLQHLPQLPVPAIDNGTAISGQAIYWPAASVFTAFPHPQKMATHAALSELIKQSDDADARIFDALQHQLAQLPIGERVFTPLDYDAVRITPALNPLITQSITLVLPPKPTHVLVVGAVKQPGFFPWQPRQDVDSYVSQADVATHGMSQADNSEAIVIQPDGTVETHAFAYWNHQHQDIAPGATVYLPFADLPRDAASLNDEIVHLLRNRAL